MALGQVGLLKDIRVATRLGGGGVELDSIFEVGKEGKPFENTCLSLPTTLLHLRRVLY